MSTLPKITGSKEAEELLDHLIGSGYLSSEALRARLDAMREQTSNQAAVALAPPVTPGESVISVAPEIRLSFADAKEALKGTLDLETLRAEAFQSHLQWGLVQALIERGMIKTPDEYGALFDNVTLSEKAILILQEGILDYDDRNPLALFTPPIDPERFSIKDLFETLVSKAGIPYFKDTNALENINAIRRIDPRNLPDLQNLPGKSYEDHLKAFRAAYEASPRSEPKPAQLLFTPDSPEVIEVGRKASEDAILALQKGKTYINLFSDFIRFRHQLDRGLQALAERDHTKLAGLSPDEYAGLLRRSFETRIIDSLIPDRGKITRYPLDILPSGSVPNLSWYLVNRRLDFSDWNPDSAHGNLGPRLVLG